MGENLTGDGKKIKKIALLQEAKKSMWCASIWRAVDSVYADADEYLDVAKLNEESLGTWGYVAIQEIIYDYKYGSMVLPETYHEQQALLEQRTADELAIYLAKQELQSSHQIVKAAYEIVSRQDIEMSLRENDFSDEALGVLLGEHHLMDTLYERWLKWDGSGMEALCYCINKWINDQLREPVHFACRIGENFFSIHVTDEGYNFDFYDKNYNLIDGGVYDEWGSNEKAAMDSVIKEIGTNWGGTSWCQVVVSVQIVADG